MKKKKKYNKEHNWEILCICLALFFLFCAGRNYYKFSRLEKYGTIETVVVKSCSIRTNHGRSGTYYHVKIEYSLLYENLIKTCSFDFKPSMEYSEKQRIQIIRDPKNNFKLPVAEKEAFKRSEITGNLIRTIGLILLMLLSRGMNYLFEKNRNKNKIRKKLAKKNPELKEKYKKEENVKSVIALILLAPFLLVEYFSEKIKNKMNWRNKGK